MFQCQSAHSHSEPSVWGEGLKMIGESSDDRPSIVNFKLNSNCFFCSYRFQDTDFHRQNPSRRYSARKLSTGEFPLVNGMVLPSLRRYLMLTHGAAFHLVESHRLLSFCGLHFPSDQKIKHNK